MLSRTRCPSLRGTSTSERSGSHFWSDAGTTTPRESSWAPAGRRRQRVTPTKVSPGGAGARGGPGTGALVRAGRGRLSTKASSQSWRVPLSRFASSWGGGAPDNAVPSTATAHADRNPSRHRPLPRTAVLHFTSTSHVLQLEQAHEHVALG